MKVPDLYVGKKFQVGVQKPELFGRGPAEIRHSSFMDGPCLIGNPSYFENVEGTLMVSPMINLDSSKPNICEEIKFEEPWTVSPCGVDALGSIKGLPLYNAYTVVIRTPLGSTHVTAPPECVPGGIADNKSPALKEALSAVFVQGDIDVKGHIRIDDPYRDYCLSVLKKASFSDDIVVRQDVIVGSDVVAEGNITASGEVKSGCGAHVLSRKKNFDIPHPTKEGWRLTHTCVEGPEASVYIRGRIKNKKEIPLPEYWKGLVDIHTITVNLTPIGSHQDVIIKRWDEENVYLQSKGGMPIDCFYHIMAERIDTEKLIVEYEGTIEDYPGDNSQRSIAGYHYDVKED